MLGLHLFYPPHSSSTQFGLSLPLSSSVVLTLLQISYLNPSMETVFSPVICDSTLTIWGISDTTSFFLYLFQFSTHHGNTMLILDSGPDSLCCFLRDLFHVFKSQTYVNDAQTDIFNCDNFCKFINLYLTAIEVLMVILISLKLTEQSSWSCFLTQDPTQYKGTQIPSSRTRTSYSHLQ